MKSSSSSGTFPRLLLVTVLAAGLCQPAFAASATWSGTTDGTWLTGGAGGNWSGSVAPGATTGTTNTDTATFNGAGNGNTAITVDSGRNIGAIQFTGTASPYTIGSAGVNAGNSLLLSSGGNISILSGLASNAVEKINAPVVLEGNDTFSNNSANAEGTLNINGQVGGATGATVLTLSGSNTNTNTISGSIVNGSATSVGVTKSGTGSWVLTGANTYTGATAVNGGTLNLNFSSNTSIVSSSSALVMGGGTLLLTGKSGAVDSQAFAGTTFNAGGSAITLNSNSATSLGLNLGAITHNAGGTVVFTLPGGAQTSTNGIVTSTGNTNGLLGNGDGWAIINSGGTAANNSAAGYTFATVSGGNIGAYTSATASATNSSTWGGNIPAGGSGTGNYDVSAAGFGATAALQGSARNVNTIRYTGTGFQQESNQTTTIQANAIMNAGTGFLLIGGGGSALNLEIGVSNELVLAAMTGGISSFNTVVNNGSTPSSLTVMGAGGNIVSLSSANYTGTTTIDSGGTLNFTQQAALYNNNTASWTAVNLVVTPGGTADFSVGGATGFTSANLDTLLALGTATAGFENGSTIGIDTGNASFIYNTAIANTNGGNNVVNLTKFGTNTLTLGGLNTYTGATTVSSGTLTAGVAQSGSAGAFGTNSAVTVNSGATLNLAGNAETIGSLTGSGTVTLGAGVLTVGSDNSTLAAFSGVISSTTAGNGLTKVGGGTLTLTNSNTYNGTTSVNAGELDLSASTNAIVSNVSISGGTLKETASNQIGDSNSVSLTGGAFNIGSFTDTVNSLTMAGGAINGSGGTLTSTGAPTFNGTSATSTISSGATVASTAQASVTSGNTFTVNGTLSDAAGLNVVSTANVNGTGSITGTVTLNGSNTLSSATTLSTGGITVTGAGNKVSSGTITGATTINNTGVFYVNSGAKLSSAVGINSGGTLGGLGTVGNTTMNAGGAINLQDTVIGMLTTGSLTLTPGTGSALSFDIKTTTIPTNTTTVDSISAGILTIGSGTGSITINIGNLTGTSTLVAGQYSLIADTNGSALSMSDFSKFSLAGAVGGVLSFDGDNLTLLNTSTGVQLNVAAPLTNGQYTLTTTTGTTTLHESTTLTASTTTLNTILANTGTGTQDSLNYSGLTATATAGTIGTATGTTTGTNLAQGANTSPGATQTYTAAMTSGTVTISNTGTVTNATLGGMASGTHSMTTINVYSGQSNWNSATDGAWGLLGTTTGTNTFGQNWVANNGSPGLDPNFTGVDTATFGTVSGSGTATLVHLNGAAPNLNSITFSTSNTSYTIDQGTGSSSITLSGSAPAINVTAGSHTINAPLILGAATSINGGGTLAISGNISGAALTQAGSGTTTLTGNNTYSHTVVSGGTLYANAVNAATPIGTGSVTISGGTFAGTGTFTNNFGVASGATFKSGMMETGTVVTGKMTMASGVLDASVGNATLSFNIGAGTDRYDTTSLPDYASFGFAAPSTDSSYLTVLSDTAKELKFNVTMPDIIHLDYLTDVSANFKLGIPYLLINAPSDADYSGLITSGMNQYDKDHDIVEDGYVLNLDLDTTGSAAAQRFFLVDGKLLVVPEPGTWALMIGGLAALLLTQRRRKNRVD